MKLNADSKGTIRHFSAKLGWKEQFDPKEIELLFQGAVPTLVRPVSVHGRKNNVIEYDITPFSSVEFYISCLLDKKKIGELLLQCIETFREVQRFYLNYRNLVLELGKVYVMLDSQVVRFIYLPLMNSKREASIPDFFRLLITQTKKSTHEQAEFPDFFQNCFHMSALSGIWK